MIVLGDSQLVINHARTIGIKSPLKNSTTWIRLKTMLKCFQFIQLFHILRALNFEVDEHANKGMRLKLGEAIMNGALMDNIIPP